MQALVSCPGACHYMELLLRLYVAQDEFPPFVNVLDFKGPAELGKYLKEIVSNDTLWTYFTDRGPNYQAKVKKLVERYRGQRIWSKALNQICLVCEVLHQEQQD